MERPKGDLDRHQTLLGQISLHGGSHHSAVVKVNPTHIGQQQLRLKYNRRVNITNTSDIPVVPSSGDQGDHATEPHATPTI